MTEAEWRSADSVYTLTHHKSSRSDRKRRLLAIACARRVLPFLTDVRFATVVAECERYADAELTWADMLGIRKVFRAAAADLEIIGGSEHQNHAAGAVGALAAKEFMSYKMAIEVAAAAHASNSRPRWDEGRRLETESQLMLAYDILGNPFRPVTFAPSWRTSTTLGLAAAMYAAHDFASMPVLADAIEEAGCDHADVLAHCRNPQQVHVRGCWVVDLVLGKS